MEGRVRKLYPGIVVILVPSLLILMSAIFIRPGAWRNFLCSAFLGGGYWVFLLGTSWQSGRWFFYFRAVLVLVITAMSAFQDHYLFIHIPKECPSCQRRGLVPGRIFGESGYEDSMYTSQRHRYRWCGSCGARFKRPCLGSWKFGPWEDASSPLDDKQFWLWSFADLRRILGRVKPSAVADPRDDPAVERVE
jgi:hypothetical protein